MPQSYVLSSFQPTNAYIVFSVFLPESPGLQFAHCRAAALVTARKGTIKDNFHKMIKCFPLAGGPLTLLIRSLAVDIYPALCWYNLSRILPP